jgi:hypothetical protein
MAVVIDKTEFNKEWKILNFPNPERGRTQFIGLDKALELIKNPSVITWIFEKLEESEKDFEEVKIRGRVRLKFVRH